MKRATAYVTATPKDKPDIELRVIITGLMINDTTRGNLGQPGATEGNQGQLRATKGN